MTPMHGGVVPGKLAAWAPWTDKKGRLHPLRAVVFMLLLLPGIWLAAALLAAHAGRPRRSTQLIHSTGYWAVWFLVASLMVTPAKALLGLPNIAVVRRMIGNAALAYAADPPDALHHRPELAPADRRQRDRARAST